MKNAISISALIVCIAGCTFFPFLWKGFYYQAIAMTFVLLAVAMRCPGPVDKRVSTLWIWYALNNLADELFFEPQSIGFNEYILAAIILIVTLRSHAIRQTP